MFLPAGLGIATSTGSSPDPFALDEIDVDKPMEFEDAREQMRSMVRALRVLKGTVTHYRAWMSLVQARYLAYNPDAARPARRVYVGNLDATMTDHELLTYLNRTLKAIGGSIAPGAPVVSVKMYTTRIRGPGSSDSAGPDRGGHAGGLAATRPGATMGPAPGPGAGLGSDGARRGSDSDARGGGGGGAGGGRDAAGPNVTVGRSRSGSKVGEHASSAGLSYQERAYAFVELRSVEEASNAMALDGTPLRGAHLKVRRPNNYDSGVAALLGPPDPNPALDLSVIARSSPRGIVRTLVSDGPHKVFIGGLPCDWSDLRVHDFLSRHGRLAAFNLITDRVTGNSKGYAFFEYADVSVTDAAIAALNGKLVKSKILTVKRALLP